MKQQEHLSIRYLGGSVTAAFLKQRELATRSVVGMAFIPHVLQMEVQNTWKMALILSLKKEKQWAIFKSRLYF